MKIKNTILMTAVAFALGLSTTVNAEVTDAERAMSEYMDIAEEYAALQASLVQQEAVKAVNSTPGLFLSMDALFNGQVNDSAGAPNPADLIGNKTSSRLLPGVRGKSLSISSTDYASVADSTEVDIKLEDFSISMWVKTTASSGIKALLDKRASEGGAGYLLALYNGRVLFQMASSSHNNFTNDSSPSVADGKWHLISVTVDRDNTSGGKLYVDGQTVMTFNPTPYSGSLSNTSKLLVGRHMGGVDNFSGSLDEVIINKRVMSSSEINSLIPTNGIPTARTGIIEGKLEVASQDSSSITLNYTIPETTMYQAIEVCWTKYPTHKDNPCEDTPIHFRNVTADKGTQGQVKFDSLDPDTTYYFGMAGRKNAAEYDNLNKAEGKTAPAAAAPPAIPSKVWVDQITPISARVNWTSGQVVEDYYKVCWAKTWAVDICNGNSAKVFTTASNASLPLNDLQPGTRYKVKVFPDGYRGGNALDGVEYFTTSAMPTIDVWIQSRTTSSLQVMWTANNLFTSYTICWKHAGVWKTPCESGITTVYAPKTSYPITGLSRNEKYKIQVYGNYGSAKPIMLWEEKEKTNKR